MMALKTILACFLFVLLLFYISKLKSTEFFTQTTGVDFYSVVGISIPVPTTVTTVTAPAPTTVTTPASTTVTTTPASTTVTTTPAPTTVTTTPAPTTVTTTESVPVKSGCYVKFNKKCNRPEGNDKYGWSSKSVGVYHPEDKSGTDQGCDTEKKRKTRKGQFKRYCQLGDSDVKVLHVPDSTPAPTCPWPFFPLRETHNKKDYCYKKKEDRDTKKGPIACTYGDKYPNTKWGTYTEGGSYPWVKTCYMEECYRGDGTDYIGKKNVTKTGKTCQNWINQTPHKHSRTPVKYPGKGLGDHNECRNPDGEKRPWCYTIDSDSRWEYCDIKKCSS